MFVCYVDQFLQGPRVRANGSCGRLDTVCEMNAKTYFEHNVTRTSFETAMKVLAAYTFVAPFEAIGMDNFVECISHTVSLPMQRMVSETMSVVVPALWYRRSYPNNSKRSRMLSYLDHSAFSTGDPRRQQDTRRGSLPLTAQCS